MRRLKDIRKEWENCRRCPLHESRKNIVFGDGPRSAELMIVGEAPGAAEDEEGKPFVGESGELLDQLLGLAGIKRETVFMTNVISCRPPRNRTPVKEEIHACAPRLYDIIYAVDPVLLVLMGAVAAKTLAKVTNITAKRGMVFVVNVPGVEHNLQYPALVTLHPAFLLRNPETGPDGWTAKVIEDLRWAARIVQEVLSH